MSTMMVAQPPPPGSLSYGAAALPRPLTAGHSPGDGPMLERRLRSVASSTLPSHVTEHRETLSETDATRGSNLKWKVCIKTAQSPK